MVEKKKPAAKKEDASETEGPQYETQQEKEDREDPTAERRAEQGDVRVPSNPLRPADIPPEPLTRHEYSETSVPDSDAESSEE